MDGLESLLAFMDMVKPVPDDPLKVNEKICKKCAELFKGMTCCERLPCAISPGEIKDLSFQGICDLLDTGMVSIDWYVGDPSKEDSDEIDSFDTDVDPFTAKADENNRAYFLRMRAKNKPLIHPAIFPCSCKLLSSTGCMLPFTHRPKGGRELIPVQCDNLKQTFCHTGYTKKDCAYEWSQYSDLLKQVFDYYKSKTSRATDKTSELEAMLSAFADFVTGFKE